MSTINTEQIDKIEQQLDGVITALDSYQNTLQNVANSAGEKAQEAINEAMGQLSEKVNTQLNSIRQKVIDIFSAQYQIAMEKIAPVKALLDALPISADLGAVVSVLTGVVNLVTAPYQPIIEFTTQVIPKVLSISTKIQTIASYQPNFDIPGVEVPPLEINVAPITPGDITG